VNYDDAVPAIERHQDLRNAVRDLCGAFPDSYWRELDAARAYPGAFVKALTDAGYLAALIPEEYVAPISTSLTLAYVAEHVLVCRDRIDEGCSPSAKDLRMEREGFRPVKKSSFW